MALPTEHRIWHVPEIVEAILSHLPAKDLLLSRAVCTTWMKIIERSIKCKKALYLEPEGEVWRWPDPYSLEEADIHAKLNPLLRRQLKDLDEGCNHFDSHGKIVIHDVAQGCDRIWRDKLLTQPPIADFATFIHFFWGDEGNFPDLAYVTVENARGLTMGDITRALDEEIERDRAKYSEPFNNFAIDLSPFLEYLGMDEYQHSLDENDDDINEDEDSMDEDEDSVDEDEDSIDEDEDFIDVS